MTQLADAFHRAGYRDVQEQLWDIGAEAVALLPHGWVGRETQTEKRTDPLWGKLKELTVEAFKIAPKWDDARDKVFAAVRGDAALLWALFEPYRSLAVQRLLTEVVQEMRAAEMERRGRTSDDNRGRGAPSLLEGGGGRAAAERLDADVSPSSIPQRNPHPPKAGTAKANEQYQAMAARAEVVRLSMLDTLKIEGRSIGEWSAGEAKAWARRTGLHVRFVEMLTSNLPDGDPISRWIKPDEADELWKRAQEVANAA